MMKIAVIGGGEWGRNLIRVFNEIGALGAICDIDKSKLRAYSEKFPGVKVTDSIGNVLSDSRIRAVVIATPAATHYEIAKKALLNKKDVFVEKPLALTVKEGEALLALAREKRKVLMVGHILQYHPAIRKLKEMIDKGQLGDVEHIYSNRLNIGKLRTEENILWSFAPHDISAILMLLGKEPIRVTASGGDYINKGIYDMTLTVLEFEGGVKGHIFVSWLHPFKEQKLVIVGTKAMAVFDDLTKEKVFIYPHRIEWKGGKVPVAMKAQCHSVEIEDKEPLKEEARYFMECVKKRKTPKTDAREGIRVLKILEKAEESLVLKRSVSVASGKDGFFAHPSAYIDEDVDIGKGVKIWHFSHILKGTKIGDDCIVGQNVTIGPGVTIGKRCKIQNNVSLYKGVVLEDEVFCGPSCVFKNVYRPRAFIKRKDEFLKTTVKRGATIGANATIVCGVTIGRYSFVGAGAVVKKDVPDHALVAGVPARQIGWVCKCAVPLKGLDKLKSAKCGRCGSSYKLKGGRVTAT